MNLSVPDLNPLDWIFAGIMLYTALRGALRGLIREVLGLASVAGAYLLANLLHPLAAPGIERLFESKTVGAVSSYALVFIGSMLALNLLSRIIDRILNAAPAKVVNVLGGTVVGAAKGLLVVTIILFVVRPLPEGREMVKDSHITPYLTPAADFLDGQLRQRLPSQGGFAILRNMVEGAGHHGPDTP